MREYYNNTYSFYAEFSGMFHLQEESGQRKERQQSSPARRAQQSNCKETTQLNGEGPTEVERTFKNKLTGKGTTFVYILYPIKIVEFAKELYITFNNVPAEFKKMLIY